jgi:hypothetical protein
MTIWNFESRILNSVPLTAEEMRVVEEALRSGNTSEQVLACEAMLRIGGQTERTGAEKALSRIVDDANSGKTELTPNLIMALFHLSGPALSQPTFRAALMRAASHAEESVRVNCMVALTNALRDGSSWAEHLLRAGLQDVSEEVRQNARAGLTLAK